MGYKLTRFVIDVDNDFPEDVQELDQDFFLIPDDRKVVHGIVRDEYGNPVPCAVVKFFKLVDSKCPEPYDPCTTCDLEPLGHAITDDCGQFLLGPLAPGTKVVIKIFFLKQANQSGTQPPCPPGICP